MRHWAAVMEEIGCKHTYMLANKHCVAISLLYSNTMFACLCACALSPPEQLDHY